MLNLNKLLNLITFRSNTDKKIFNHSKNDLSLELPEKVSNDFNQFDSSFSNNFEKLQSYNREIVYCSLIFVIGKSFYFTIKDLFQLNFKQKEKKKIKSLFGIVKSIKQVSDQVQIFLIDPSFDETFTFFSTNPYINLGDIIKICNFEVESKNLKLVGTCNDSTQILSFNTVTKVFENEYNFLKNGDIYIISELRKWFSKKVIENSLQNVKDAKYLKNIAFKMLYYKKFKEYINLVILDGNEHNQQSNDWQKNLSLKDLFKVRTNFQNLIKFNFDLNVQQMLMDKMCLFVKIYSNNLAPISKLLSSKLTQNKDVFVFYNFSESSIKDKDNKNKDNDDKEFKLICEPFQFTFMHLSCCDNNSYLINSLNKKIDSTFLSIKVKQLCDEVNFYKRKSFDYFQSTPSKKFKNDDEDTNSAQKIQVFDQQNFLSSINQSVEKKFIDPWIEEEINEFESANSNESSDSTIIYSISDDSLTEEEEVQVKQSSQINSKQDFKENYPYSLQALKSMDKYKLIEYKKLVIKSRNDATQNDKSSLTQLIEMIDQVLENFNPV